MSSFFIRYCKAFKSLIFKRDVSYPLVELVIAEMACVSRNIRSAVSAAYGIPVQRSISERDVSYPLVELGLTGLTCTSRTVR